MSSTAAPTATHRLDVDGAIGVVTVAYPPVNALSRSMRQAIIDGIAAAQAHPAVQAIVFICDGRTFLAGADITEFGKPPQAPSLYEAQDMIENSTKPVIAAVNGVTRGAGCNMAFAADFRILSEQANFGVNFVERGLMGETATWYLPRLVGHAKAAELCLLGEPFDAAQAKAMGLAYSVVPHDKLMDESMVLARKLNSKAPIAVQMTKVALRRAWQQDVEQQLELQNTMNNKLKGTEDTKEALRAFIEKRPPQFKGA